MMQVDDRLPMLRALIGEIRLVHDALAAKLDQGVNINNLDVVEASLHNELNSTTKQLLSALKELKKVTETQTKAIEEALKEENKPEGPETVIVENLKDAPTDIKVNNLSELENQFNKIVDAVKALNLSVNVPESVVNVPAPIVNVPETVVNIPETVIPEVDISPIIRELDIQLNKIRTNSVSRPLAVRLTNGQEWINQLTVITEKAKEAFGAFPGAIRISNISEFQTTNINYAIKVDTTSTTNVVYVGKASIGTSSTSSAVWQIMKVNTTSGAIITWADGNDKFDNIWDNITSITYV